MSEEYYKSSLSQYLDIYFNAKKNRDNQNQIAALNQIINILQTLVQIAPYQRKTEYTNQLNHSRQVLADLQSMSQSSQQYLPGPPCIEEPQFVPTVIPVVQPEITRAYSVPTYNQAYLSPSIQSPPHSPMIQTLPHSPVIQPMQQPRVQYTPQSPVIQSPQQPMIQSPAYSPRVQYSSQPKLQPKLQPKPLQQQKKKEDFIDRPLTLEEKDILIKSSVFNGMECLVWLDSDAKAFTREHFVDSFDYRLSRDQLNKGSHFEDPTRLYSSPDVIKWPLNPFNIKQMRVADCTIISSIISCANHEVRFKKPLITGIIYPQVNGRPVFNPYGKYYVKLWFNGIPRRVEVDHRVLVTKENKPVSTYSKQDGELWSILIEKAFLKVHGGYSYDGGNGGQDTYSLTGWIPELLILQDETQEKQREYWTRVSGAFNCGDCIVTAGTLANLPAEAVQLGLSEGHCYCICRMETVEGKCLLQLRNPWGVGSWKGAYSYQDTVHWTSSLRTLCSDYQYRISHPDYDDGLFWMEFSDFVRYFRGFNVNWSTSLLNCSITYHSKYTNFLNGTMSDTRDMCDCPQYSIEINNPTNKPYPVYVMLSRHYVHYEDLLGTEKKKTLLSIQAYKTNKPMYMIRRTDETTPIEHEIVFTNIPYDLAKFRVPPGRHFYTVVVMTMKENASNLYPFNFSIVIRYPHLISAIMKPMFSVPSYHFMTRLAGAWTNTNSGGRPSQGGYQKNPMYSFSLSSPTSVHISLETGQSPQPCNIRLIREEDLNQASRSSSMIKDSGPYVAHVCSLEVDLDPGNYRVIASPFDVGYTGDYTITARSSKPVSLTEYQTVYRPLPGLDDSMQNFYTVSGWVSDGSGESVFGANGFRYCRCCRVKVSTESRIIMKLTASLGCRPVVAVFISKDGSRPVTMTEANACGMSSKKETTSVTNLVTSLNPGYYYICYGLMENGSGDLQLRIYSSNPLAFYYIVC